MLRVFTGHYDESIVTLSLSAWRPPPGRGWAGVAAVAAVVEAAAPAPSSRCRGWTRSVQYSTVQYSTVQYSTVQYSTDLTLPLRRHSSEVLLEVWDEAATPETFLGLGIVSISELMAAPTQRHVIPLQGRPFQVATHRHISMQNLSNNLVSVCKLSVSNTAENAPSAFTIKEKEASPG